MTDVWDLWDTQGQYWHSLFHEIDPAIARFIQLQANREVQVIEVPYRWDEPSRLLIFPSLAGLGIWNNIEIFIKGTFLSSVLRFSCAAWRDEDLPSGSGRRRFWCHSSRDLQESWQFRPGKKRDQATVGALVEERLSTVFQTVTEWRLTNGLWHGTGVAPESPAVVP
jgi:hypothetical protein